MVTRAPQRCVASCQKHTKNRGATKDTKHEIDRFQAEELSGPPEKAESRRAVSVLLHDESPALRVRIHGANQPCVPNAAGRMAIG